jgi:hypothetical protein
MNTEVKITAYENFVEYDYKGIKIDTTTWECAPFPIYCGGIDDESMCCIVRTLYDILVEEYGREMVERYINEVNGFDEWDSIDDFRWSEEEELFLEWGGKYYEDIFCPNCESEKWTNEGDGKAVCDDCGHKFSILG